MTVYWLLVILAVAVAIPFAAKWEKRRDEKRRLWDRTYGPRT